MSTSCVDLLPTVRFNDRAVEYNGCNATEKEFFTKLEAQDTKHKTIFSPLSKPMSPTVPVAREIIATSRSVWQYLVIEPDIVPPLTKYVLFFCG